MCVVSRRWLVEGNRNRNGVEIETQEETDHAETDNGDYDDRNLGNDNAHSNGDDTSAVDSASITDTTHQDTNGVEDHNNGPSPSNEALSQVGSGQ